MQWEILFIPQNCKNLLNSLVKLSKFLTTIKSQSVYIVGVEKFKLLLAVVSSSCSLWGDCIWPVWFALFELTFVVSSCYPGKTTMHYASSSVLSIGRAFWHFAAESFIWTSPHEDDMGTIWKLPFYSFEFLQTPMSIFAFICIFFFFL